jgi:3-methyladenine DNA glycosylase AlkD
VQKYAKANEQEKTRIYELYLKNTKYINNWDLVDSSAHHIVGVYLEHRDRQPLYQLVESNSLWERRIAIMSTFHFIRKNEFDDTLNLSKRLINDTEDLIHKAVGWMLREIGKRDLGVEEVFLKAYYQNMPRTMLRYAIERFREHRRKQYLNGEV